jgi:hypothetical protein
MKVSIELNIHELFEQFISEREQNDPINSLSIVFDRREDNVYAPALFFCPDWDVDFEARVFMTDALQEYLDEDDNDDADHRDLMTRLLATIDEWIKQQKEQMK